VRSITRRASVQPITAPAVNDAARLPSNKVSSMVARAAARSPHGRDGLCPVRRIQLAQLPRKIRTTPAAAPRLRELIDLERECCAWIHVQVDGRTATRLEILPGERGQPRARVVARAADTLHGGDAGEVGHRADHDFSVRHAARRSNGLPTPTYYFHLGVALAAKGDKAGARKEIETALRLSEKTNFPEANEARKTLATL